MLNEKDGSINLLKNDIPITPYISIQEFKKSELYNLLSATKRIGSFLWFIFNSIDVVEYKLNISVCFKDEKIVQMNISMVSYSENDKTWSSWRHDDEAYSKKRHDRFLVNEIGQPPYNYKWGTIKSVYDSKGGHSTIIITYN